MTHATHATPTPVPAPTRSAAPRTQAADQPGLRVFTLLALGAIMLLAAVLRLVDLGVLGDGNTYYTAAVESMLQSWPNFFFAAAEPGASVTVDKPPLGLWLQTVSAYVFGVNGFAVMLPQIVAGVLSVPLIFHLVGRRFGHWAGLLAALTLAITPVAIAADRNNTMDSTLTFALLLAAWAFLRAAERGSLRTLLIGAVLVGLAFNIKMLQAFLPVPAFYAVYFLGARMPWRTRIGHLALATVVLLVVALSWAVIVDLTPADQRPYVGSSENNTVMELITGHNGLARLLGHDAPSGGGGNAPTGNVPASPGGGTGAVSSGTPGGVPGGDEEIGSPGLWRLVTPPLDNEIGWWIVFALAAVPLLLLVERLRWPLNERYLALGLWTGWLLAGIVFFSRAEFFHAYYFVMLAPAVAALVGVGAWSLWVLLRDHPRVGVGFALLVLSGTWALQWHIVSEYPVAADGWIVLAVLIMAAGAMILLSGVLRRDARFTAVGMAVTLVSVLVLPGVWGVWTALDDSPDVHLPAAYAGEAGSSGTDPDRAGLTTALVDYLEPRTQNTQYLIAVPSSMTGAELVLATGRPVLYIGGFGGEDPVASADDLAQMVADGDLRYVLDDGSLSRQESDIGAWLSDSCSAVDDVAIGAAMLGGRPDGPPGDGGPGTGAPPGGGPPAGGLPGGGRPDGPPGMGGGSAGLYMCG